MSDEMKLLRALCDALGFEVETTLDYAPLKEGRDATLRYNVIHLGQERFRRLAASGPDNKLDRDEDGYYTSLLIEPIVNYKVIPKTK